jgi:hypothetical protein
MNRKPPRKPSMPLAQITFRAAGGVDATVEPLSPLKEELELTIVRKFVASVQAEGLPKPEPKRADPWPDVEVRIDGQSIGIEVVEVIDPDHAQKRATQERYLVALLPLLTDLEERLHHVVMTVVDGYQEPRWPNASSPQGQRLVLHIAERIRGLSSELAVMPSSARLHRSWNDFEGSSLQLGLLASGGRRIAAAQGSGLDLGFSGTFPSDVASIRGLLAGAITAKITKSYAPYPNGGLWLLAYAQDFSAVDEESVTCAQKAVSGVEHNFEAIWAFFPLPGERGGHARQVFHRARQQI